MPNTGAPKEVNLNTTSSTQDINKRWVDYTRDYYVQHAIDVIEGQIGLKCRVTARNVIRAGRTFNADSGIPTTVMTLPGDTQRHETLATGNTIDTISSSSASDTTDVLILGTTLDGTDYIRATPQIATLNGQNKVPLTTPLHRVTILRNDGAVDFVGNIFCYEDDTITAGVPDTDTKVKIMIVAGQNQSEKAAGSIAKNQCFIMTKFFASTNKDIGTSAAVDVRFESKSQGKTYIHDFEINIHEDGDNNIEIELKPHIIVRPNSDIRLVATSNTANVSVSAGVTGFIAEEVV